MLFIDKDVGSYLENLLQVLFEEGHVHQVDCDPRLVQHAAHGERLVSNILSTRYIFGAPTVATLMTTDACLHERLIEGLCLMCAVIFHK